MSGGETLGEAQHGQQHRRDDPGLVVFGQNTHEGRGATHDRQRRDEGALASQLVAEVTEDHGADGAGDESHGEDEERLQSHRRRVALRKEQRCKDDGRGGTEKEEVVPLEGGAQKGTPDDATDVSGTRTVDASRRCNGHGGS